MCTEEKPKPVHLAHLHVGEVIYSNICIPAYQRIYCWRDRDILQFWKSINDIEEIHLGTVILYENGKDNEIVDGQQRLLTLSLMLENLSDTGPTLLRMTTTDEEEVQNIANAKWVIATLFSRMDAKEKQGVRKKLLRIQFTKISISEKYPDLAYVFFTNQNSKGVKLTDYDLLKAHHLRFITDERAEIKAALSWASSQEQMVEGPEKKPSLHHALGFLVYRLRKLLRRRAFDEVGHYVRDEFISILPPKNNLSRGRNRKKTRQKTQQAYHAPIEGGEYFFAFARHFFDEYQKFEKTSAAQKLCRLHNRHRHFYEMAQCLLFAYFLKFGKENLVDALFCICAVLGHYRYGLSRATKDAVHEMTLDSELIYLIDQAPTPRFFFGQVLIKMELLPPDVAAKIPPASMDGAARQSTDLSTLQDIKAAWKKGRERTIKKDYYAIVCEICKDLEKEVSVAAVREKIKEDYTLPTVSENADHE